MNRRCNVVYTKSNSISFYIPCFYVNILEYYQLCENYLKNCVLFLLIRTSVLTNTCEFRNCSYSSLHICIKYSCISQPEVNNQNCTASPVHISK